MNVYIDESGSFVDAEKPGSWNCVVAYLTPEADRRDLRLSLKELKRSRGLGKHDEIKLRDAPEVDYLAFLRRLNRLNGVLFSAATDAGANDAASVVAHRTGQSEKITEHKSKMNYESARKELEDLAAKVRKLAPQLYVQLHCQVNLIAEVINCGVLYFVQRYPKSLGRFRWRIDQKNATRTLFEETFLTLLPPLLQSISLRSPMPMLKDADYSAFQRFDYPEGEAPTYLKDAYGIETSADTALNIGKLIREDLKFEESQANKGVQIADLLASGLRRYLRGGFSDWRTAGQLLGHLMIRQPKNRASVLLLGFHEQEIFVDDHVSRRINFLSRSGRGMLAR